MTSSTTPPGTSGTFNYLDASIVSSIYRNGRVLTRRDKDGSDTAWEGVIADEKEVFVQDARGLNERRTLEAHGFELLHRPLGAPQLDFYAHQEVVKTYYGECAEIVKAASGASEVFAFDHNVRSAVGKADKKRIDGGQQVQGPAHIVHGDYTLTSGPQRLRDLTNPPKENDTLRTILGPNEALLSSPRVEEALGEGRRFAIINLWRNIVAEPVQVDPLALCDGQTVTPKDLVVFEIHYADRVGENYFAKYDDAHQWYYYPEMTRDEALLIKQWDSAGELARSKGTQADGAERCTFSFHSAFEVPDTPDDAPPRWSIEVRCIALYD